MIDYKILNRKDFFILEDIRKDASGKDVISDYFFNNLNQGKILLVGMYLDNNLIGGCYVSKSLSSLYIENIFIKYEYQHKGYGKKLLEYVFANKDIFEEYFNMKFEFSKLEPNSNDIVSFYENMGYSKPNDFNIMNKML